jgi:serine/threonine-protein kinase RsbW
MSAQVETSVLRLTLPARPEYLMFTRLVLTGLSRSIEIDPETLADLKLAVSEACSYLIRAGASAQGQLEIAYELTGDSMAVTVKVEGNGEEARRVTAVEEVDDDLGLVIIEAVVDELEIDLSNMGGERISFRKQLEPQA